MLDPRDMAISGLTCLTRADKDGTDASQEVILRERSGSVHLSLLHGHYGVRLSPAEARRLAKLLTHAADRISGTRTRDECSVPDVAQVDGPLSTFTG